jgi:glycosyltransferase involved in cell wall biosynthesis
MHVVFVCYYSFACNSAGHIACLANALAARGVEVTTFATFAPETAAQHGPVNFACHAFSEVDAWLAKRRPDPKNTVVVAWTPRENVRLFVEKLRTRLPCPYVVHLEDNELLLTAVNLGLSTDELLKLPEAELDRRLGADDRLSHPRHFPRFIAQSAGITALIDTLVKFAPSGHPHLVYWPGYNPTFFRSQPVDYTRRRQLGITDDTLVLVYPGNVHSANCAEVRSLHLAVCLLNRQGIKSVLIRTGEDYVPVLDHTLNEVARYLISLGKLGSQADVADALALGDVFVQPGHAGPFNDYRFPSKLPEFFALGRPVLLPATNLGRYVRPGIDAIVLQRGDALEIASHLAELWPQTELRRRLSTNAATFAAEHFQWSQIAAQVLLFLAARLPAKN